VYEVGHRLTGKFDDVPQGEDRTPRVFITGDACHTHSAQAGQGMNVSMQDAFNLGWKVAHVLGGRSPESLLATYSAERQVVAKDLIDFDKEWSTLMAKSPEEFDSPKALGEFYTTTAEFPAGFMTQYRPSMIVSEATHQELATGFPLGKRFKSARVVRVADTNPRQLGHHHQADGRWRLYAFGDAPGPGERSQLTNWAMWLAESANSPLLAYTPDGAGIDSVFDVKVVYQQQLGDVDLGRVPQVFLPRSGPFELIDYEKVYGTLPGEDIFDVRGVDRSGCVIVVRPDQYVAAIRPLTATADLAAFFAQMMLVQRAVAPTAEHRQRRCQCS